MKPFVMDWRDNGRAMVDVSSLLDKPAGRDGFVGVKDGHFVTGSGKRLRLWGVNFTGAACYPEKDDAGVVADHLARFGVNCVRFHFLDSNWGADAGIFPRGADTTRRLDAAQLDRLDHFVWQLKRRGIYSNINLNVGRVYRKGDGVRDHGLIGLGKALHYFDDHIAELHREYARQLLTHRNPYTKAEYRNEPAIATVELVNENSLIESWFSGRLRGKQTRQYTGTWCDITAHYEKLLTRKFHAHLGATTPRLQPREFQTASKERFCAEAKFYMALEDRYFQAMCRFLKKLGVRAPIAATSDHNHWKSGYPLLSSTAKLDVVDGHVYWQHPRRRVAPKTGKRSFWMGNSPMVNQPLGSSVVQLARSAVAGKPYTVSETNHPVPSDYACEGIPILTAYALLADWDGIFFYTFEHSDPKQWMSRSGGHFDTRPDPVRMTQLAAGALMFHRADVAPARKTVGRSYSTQQVIESIRMSSSQRPFFTPGFSNAVPLVHATRIESFHKAKTTYPAFDAPSPIVSDTGELTWRGAADKKGLVTVETDRTQAMIGFVGGGRKQLPDLAVDVDTPFCSIVLTSLDGEPLARSRRMLLSATARSRPTGMTWDTKRHTLLSWGKLPMLIEPVTGTVTLRRRRAGAKLTLTPLDGAAAALAKPKPGATGGEGTSFALDQPTVWYLIRDGS